MQSFEHKSGALQQCFKQSIFSEGVLQSNVALLFL